MVRKQVWLWVPWATTVSILASVVSLIYVVVFGRRLPILDFAVYHNATIAFAHGASPYDVRAYVYSPFFAWLIQPLSWLSITDARVVWYVVQIAALAGLTWSAIIASGSQLARRYWGLVWLGVVLAIPSRLDLILGQTGGLVALMVVGSFAARRRPWVAGTLLALAAMIKVYPAVLWLFFLLWHRRIARHTIVVGIILLAFSVAICGPTMHREWIDTLLGGEPYPTMAEHNNSLVGFWLRLLTVNPYVQPVVNAPWLAYTLLGVSSLGVLGSCVWLYRNRVNRHLEALHYSAWLCAMSLLAPANGIYNLMFLVLPCLAVVHVLEQRPDRTVRSTLLLVTMPCYMPLVSTFIQAVAPGVSIWHIPWLALVFTPPLYALVGYFTLLIILGTTRQAPHELQAEGRYIGGLRSPRWKA